jgi:8-oxo-dGTP pyrophosphatase MutT (NUDIX family)
LADGMGAPAPSRSKSPALSDVVRAAGGVVTRATDDGLEVLVVHRPRYADWSYPKGKAEPDESDEECALREVEEETGLVCELANELSSTSYTDGAGRPKRVRYWRMRRVGGSLRFLHEVDDARWLTRERASELLTYERDRGLLDELETEER